jgi:phosphoglucosamine mutase
MKKLKYFGTDGIRGIIGQDFDSELAVRIANATAVYINSTGTAECSSVGTSKGKVVIGWDTRATCGFIVDIFTGILSSYGINVVKIGVVPTAALSFLANRLNADLGIMVSASHCSAKYNGVKFFTPLGEKLDQDETLVFDKLIVQKSKPPHTPNVPGTITQDFDSIKLWQDFLVKKFKTLVKPGTKVAIDAAFGSGAECASFVMRELGLDVIVLNDKSTGFNINGGCGATMPSYMNGVMSNGDFDIGFAFDGDADRCLVFDEKGIQIHGDIVIYLLAKYYKDAGLLTRNEIVGTVLFNLGVEKSLNDIGITLTRTDVGDAYVYHALKTRELALGGETSGHVSFMDIWCTGDGLVLALMMLALKSSHNKKTSDIVTTVKLYPQVNINTPATPDQKKQLFESQDFKTFVKDYQKNHTDFRIIVRPSGTENIVRVTVEGESQKKCDDIALVIVEKIKSII